MTDNLKWSSADEFAAFLEKDLIEEMNREDINESYRSGVHWALMQLRKRLAYPEPLSAEERARVDALVARVKVERLKRAFAKFKKAQPPGGFASGDSCSCGRVNLPEDGGPVIEMLSTVDRLRHALESCDEYRTMQRRAPLGDQGRGEK